jgi:hypothetical protein
MSSREVIFAETYPFLYNLVKSTFRNVYQNSKSLDNNFIYLFYLNKFNKQLTYLTKLEPFELIALNSDAKVILFMQNGLEKLDKGMHMRVSDELAQFKSAMERYVRVINSIY